MTTECHIHLVPILGRGRLPIQDGYVIARFTSEGQFDRIVARLKMPIDGCHSHQLWDLDAAGTLYYLEFGLKGVGIRSVKD